VSLVNTRELMEAAATAGIGQGAFNIIHLETAEGLVAGAEAAGVPLILQISENCAKFHGGLEPLARGALAIARDASVPVALHLDHAESEELALQAVDLGFGVADAYGDEDHRPLLADDRLVGLLNQD